MLDNKTRVMFLGEHHNSSPDHDLQAALIARVRELQPNRPLAIGLEAVQKQFQPVLDAFVADEVDLTELKERVEWDKRWTWPFERYMLVLLAAKKANARLLALNVDSEDLAEVDVGGLQGLGRTRMKVNDRRSERSARPKSGRGGKRSGGGAQEISPPPSNAHFVVTTLTCECFALSCSATSTTL